MRPPVCIICDAVFEPATGGTVNFSDYTPLPENICGHPQGMEWFCQAHLERAEKMRHLDSSSAISILKNLDQTN